MARRNIYGNIKRKEKGMTNYEFSLKDKTFIDACSKVGLPKHFATICSHKAKRRGESYTNLARQASKWRNGKGLAYKEGRCT
jgi:hypothetical protein